MRLPIRVAGLLAAGLSADCGLLDPNRDGAVRELIAVTYAQAATSRLGWRLVPWTMPLCPDPTPRSSSFRTTVGTDGMSFSACPPRSRRSPLAGADSSLLEPFSPPTA